MDAAGAANTSVTHAQSAVRNQAYYLQEEAQLLHEKLYLSAAVRGERSSVNGDRSKIFTFPRVAASYRWAQPSVLPFTDEIKFRANYGQSGNQPNYGDRDLTIASYGWWTKQFEAAGLERSGEIERRIHPHLARFGLTKFWCLYVLRVPGVTAVERDVRSQDAIDALESRWSLNLRPNDPEDFKAVEAALGR